MEEKYLEDIREIKDMMNRSSKFLSLSGLSGISAGLCALIGAYLAYSTVYNGNSYQVYNRVDLTSDVMLQLVLIAIGTLAVSLIGGIYFSIREARKKNQKFWDFQTKRLLLNLAIPLVSGGLLCLIFLTRGYIGIIAPLTLVFYGLALVNASKYTLNDIRSLGILEIVLGLLAAQFLGYGLIFWAIGFGLLHIVYGIFMHLKYSS